MRWIQLFMALVAGMALGIGLGAWVLQLRGSPVRIVPRQGLATPTTLHFGEPAERPAATPRLAAPDARARGVVLVIADGMGFSHLFAARAELAGVDGRLFVEGLPVAGWLTSFADRSLYTDSAASAAAMATGRKVPPGYLAMDHLGQPVPTVLEAAVDRGLATGLITDTYLIDATPAAFVAHALRRDWPRVTDHTARAGLSLLAGATIPERPGYGPDDAFIAALERHGMHTVHDAAGWRDALANDQRVAGLFSDNRIADPAQPPSLAEVAGAALARLLRHDQGFFLLVETEEVDTGAHYHDLGRVIGGIESLDAVVRLVVEQAEAAGEVLVIVTSDHETGGLGLLSGSEGEPIRVQWATAGHTAEPVPLFAFGPGAELLAGPHDNTEIAGVIAQVLGLEMASAAP